MICLRGRDPAFTAKQGASVVSPKDAANNAGRHWYVTSCLRTSILSILEIVVCWRIYQAPWSSIAILIAAADART
jgi:hypothetical protein